MKTMRIILALSFMFMSCFVNAALQQTPTTKISKLFTYSNYPNITGVSGGDITFTVDSLPSGCDGLWVSPTDNNYKVTAAFLLSAFTSQGNVQIYAYDDQIWNGSSSKFCHVYNIILVR